MLGRFLAALLLVMLVALAGTALEKHNREQLRQISLQTYRWQVLQREYARARLIAETEGAPARMLERLGHGPASLAPTDPRPREAGHVTGQAGLSPDPSGNSDSPSDESHDQTPARPRFDLETVEVPEPVDLPATDERPSPERVAGREQPEPGD